MVQFCMEGSEGCLQESIRLVPVKLGQTGIRIGLPEGFSRMEEERQRSRYPRAGRPETILENGGSVQVTAQLLGIQVEASAIRQAAEKIRQLAGELFPQYQVSPVYLCGEGKIPTGWFRMKMEDIGSGHIKALCTTGKGLVLVTFTYPLEESVKWASVIRRSFSTWEEEDGEDQ